MGSSKKHKEKDRERDRGERKKKRKHRSRSRSRSRDRSRRREKRDRDEREEKRARRERDYSDEGEVEDFPKVEVKQEPIDVPQPTSSGGDLSLSIEETNKLRAKLGLKPLEGKDNADNSAVSKSQDEDVHKPAVNLGNIKRTEELRVKMLAAKEKRLINKKLGKVKTLGDSDDENDSALAWVMKSRKIESDREKAEKTAKLLEEMDKEFGVSNLVEEEFKSTKKEYSSKDLRGITVEHGQESFKEGRTMILTLQDKGVLDDDGDALVNVNLLDDERAAVNVENKKKKPDYNPYDDDETDEYGFMKPREILDKYDEEIHGKKKETFELGAGGKYNTEQDRKLEQLKSEFKQRAETLELPAPIVASEFYNDAELDSFKKVKKKVRKLRKKTKVTADSLLPLGDSGEHLGSRNRLRGRVNNKDGLPIDSELPRELIDKSGPIPGLDVGDSMDIDEDNPLDETEILGPVEDLSGVVVEEDKAAAELELALNKARKVKSEVKLKPPEAVADSLPIKEEQEDDNEDNDELRRSAVDFSSMSRRGGGGEAINIQLNTMEEFCRTLGEIPTYGMAGNRVEEDDEIMDFERELVESRRQQEDEEDDTGWHHVEIDTAPVEIKEEEKHILDDEPVVNAGLSAALQLANKKGYLDAAEVKKGAAAPKHKEMEAKNYSIEDKRLDDLDDKYSRKRDRFGGGGGAIMDFKEKDGYKPNVKLEYVDDNGRLMNPKEAFRFLSHRFHGKGSGKKKTEKRQKKVEEDLLMRTMSSTDTPLNTVQLLQEKQRTEKSAYVVLSGSSKGLTASNLSK